MDNKSLSHKNGNANITLYLFRNIERKFCMEE